MIRIPSRLAVIVSLIAAQGCSERDDLYHVSGNVIFDGSPLPAGVIYFNPSSENPGPQGYAVVKNGKFTTADLKGRPVSGGNYEVRIQGFDGKPDKELPLGKPLFWNYEQSVNLPKANCAWISTCRHRKKNHRIRCQNEVLCRVRKPRTEARFRRRWLRFWQ